LRVGEAIGGIFAIPWRERSVWCAPEQGQAVAEERGTGISSNIPVETSNVKRKRGGTQCQGAGAATEIEHPLSGSDVAGKAIVGSLAAPKAQHADARIVPAWSGFQNAQEDVGACWGVCAGWIGRASVGVVVRVVADRE